MFRARIRTLAGMLILLLPSAAGATPARGTSTVVVRFEHAALEVPPGKAAAMLDEVSFRVPGLKSALLRAGATRVTRMFPSFVPGAVRATNPLGEEIQLEDLSDYYVVSVGPGQALSAALHLVGTRGILSAAPPEVGSASSVPNDTYFSTQWYLNNTQQSCTQNPVADVDANAPEAWDIVPTVSSSVRLGVIDAGVSAGHPDLSGHVGTATTYSNDVPCTCLVYPDEPECATDCDKPAGTSTDPILPHGTQVAGIIGASKNNSTGIAGVASGATIVPFKVFNFWGGPLSCWLAEAIDGARVQGVPVVNMSVKVFGPDAALTAAVRNAFYSGMLVVSAVGNDGLANPPIREYPAAYSNMVCAVGAVYADGRRWTGSSYGSWLDLCAAGGANQATTSINMNASTCVGASSYLQCSTTTAGTSFAAPVVTGVAGLLLSKFAADTLVGEDLQQIMSRTAVDVTGSDPKPGYFYSAGWDSLTGWGYVRADAALNFLSSPKRLDHTQVAGLADTATSNSSVTFMNMPDPQMNGTHAVRRHLLRRAVTFFPDFYTPPTLWTRSSGTIGVKDTATFDYDTEVNSGRVLPGTLTASGCTVETCVYEVLDQNNSLIGWFPSDPGGARVAFTTVGVPDTTAPATTTDLAVDAVSRNSVILTWTAPGDDGDTGTASAYDLRMSTSPITPNNFASAGQVLTSAPHPAGYGEQLQVQSLAACTWYYFALKTRDQSNNWSAMSDVASGRTSCNGFSGSPAADDLPTVIDLVLLDSRPSASSTSLRYSVPAAAAGQPLDLSVFDVSGRRVHTIERSPATPGVHTVAWDLGARDGARLDRGIYFVRLTLAGRAITRRLVVSVGSR